MLQVTLAQLRADARRHADMVNSTFCSDADFNDYINTGIAELYGRLVAARGQGYYQKEASYTTVGGQPLYALPADFWQLVSVEIKDGSYRRVMQPFMQKEHARWAEYSVPGGFSFTMSYIPAPQKLVQDTDVFDGIAGWEHYVVLDAAISALTREESDTTILQGQQNKLLIQIERLAGDRDASWPERIVDASRQISPFVFSGGVPRYRLKGASTITGADQNIEILWGPAPNDWFGW